MFRRVPLWITLLVVTLGILSTITSAWLVLQYWRHSPWLRPLQYVAVGVATIPNTLSRPFKAMENTFLAPAPRQVPAGFWRDPGFVDPGFLLLPSYDPAQRKPLVQLLRLADGKVLRQYQIDDAALTSLADGAATPVADYRGIPFAPGHPDLLPDGGLILNGNSVLVRVDACARTKWAHMGFHHSVENAGNAEYWVPAVLPEAARRRASRDYRDETITRVSADGRLLYEQKLSHIFRVNGLGPYFLGRAYTIDPFHLNDIQPVLRDLCVRGVRCRF